MNFKNIHIGKMIEQEVANRGMELARICNYIGSTEQEIREMYEAKSADTETLLKWSKLLEYDFFRIYTQHLILYAPISAVEGNSGNREKTKLPRFRKSIYTREIIDFILELIFIKKMTRAQVIKRYKIPKSTLYKWIEKYGENKE